MLQGNIKYSIENREETSLVIVEGSFFHLGNISKDKVVVKKLLSDKVILKIEKDTDSKLSYVSRDNGVASYKEVENDSELEVTLGDKVELAWYDNSIDPVLETPIMLELVNVSEMNNFRM